MTVSTNGFVPKAKVIAAILSFFLLSISSFAQEGCTDPSAANFNPFASVDDGSCAYAGCMNEFACNYDASAEVPGPCEYPSCSDPESNNYNPNALCFDDELCQGLTIPYLTAVTDTVHQGMVGTTDLTGYITTRLYLNLVEEAQLAAMYGLIMEDENPDENDINVEFECDCFDHELGGLLANDHSCLFYDSFPELEFDSYFTINQENSCDPGFTAEAVTVPSGFNEDFCDTWIDDGAIFTLFDSENSYADENNQVFVAQVTTCGNFEMGFSVQYFVEGEVDGGGNPTPMMNYVSISVQFGCTDIEAPNFNPYANSDDGSCEAPLVEGCTNIFACDYDPEAELATACTYPECNDINACNYVSNVECSDSALCLYPATGNLAGEAFPLLENTYTYTYDGDPNGDYEWQVTGGTIVEMPAPNVIVVEWDELGQQIITVLHNDGDCPGFGPSFDVFVDQIDNVDLLEQETLNVYPNPAHELLTFEVPENYIGIAYTLTSTNGKVVRQGVINSTRQVINVTDLASGTYLLTLDQPIVVPVTVVVR
ncbi:T9SS type A sorting domain-containing protein [Sanyastnella coralliicola]|uniref:T9SS type A sorting domain-containing protein n=1 Tax=Sanyastnella coralliicola TaxID=3069118 RepID=UPI0027BA4791|nr:T9SS type A sorting domain-containing protein [Longitalea sp. SCSIO 12813]